MSNVILLKSSDGDVFTVELEIAKRSILIKTMLEDLGPDDNENEAAPLPNVDTATLKLVIEWATHHKDDPPAPEEEDKTDKIQQLNSEITDQWDKDFVAKLNQKDLFELILAANYLDIKDLLSLLCKVVANMIKGKTPEEIRRTFNIKSDPITGEEEQNRERSGCSGEN